MLAAACKATGAQAIRVPLAGNAAEQVLSVNSLDDFGVLYAQVTGSAAEPGPTSPAPMAKPTRRVLIMGAGLIGCEFANDLAAAGHPVTVVDPGARPLAALLPVGASTALSEALQAIGCLRELLQLGLPDVFIEHGDPGLDRKSVV